MAMGPCPGAGVSPRCPRQHLANGASAELRHLLQWGGRAGKAGSITPQSSVDLTGLHRLPAQLIQGYVQWTGGAGKGGMTCTTCPHLGCPHSYLKQGVMPCPECQAGTVVLDPVSAPRWRLDCNLCSFLIYLPPSLHSVAVAASKCPVRSALVVALAV